MTKVNPYSFLSKLSILLLAILFIAQTPLSAIENYLVKASFFANFDMDCRKGSLHEEEVKQLELYHFTPIINPYTLFILNLNAFEFNSDNTGANFGMGIRSAISQNGIFGFNAHYTYQDDVRALHQVTAGIEFIHRFASIHANVYTPVGTKKDRRQVVYNNYINPQNIDYIAICNQDVIATTRFDVNIIKEFKPTPRTDLHLYLGIFGFESCKRSRMIRSEAGFKAIFQHFYIFPRIFYDGANKTQATLEIGFQLPAYNSNYFGKRIRQPFVRKNPIYTINNCHYITNFNNIL